MKKTWWKESVVYQVYPRSFCDSDGDGIGDLNGIRSKLDYLKELGINVIWMSPVYQSPNDDNGYDISDYQAIMKEFGTMEDFDALLKAAHERGIRIMMDLVVNHTSDEHAWFIESRKSVDNPYHDYYIWREPKDGKAPNNWGSAFSGPAWEYDENLGLYYLHFFSKKQPDLNWENPKVRDEVFKMMNWWVDKGIDGFRMDVISLISKPEEFRDGKAGANGYSAFTVTANGPRVHEFLQEMNQKVLKNADLITVGETCGVTVDEAKKYANEEGSELNMVFQFEHVEMDNDPSNKWKILPMALPALKEIFNRWETGLSEIAWNSLFFCNHDQPRIVSRLGDGSPRAAKCIAVILHMMQGTPYVYQGEELGMTNVPFTSIDQFRDIETINAYKEMTGQGILSPEEMMEALRYKSRDNARTPMQWSDEKNAGFSEGNPWIMVNPNYKTINAKAQYSDPESVFSFYKKLISLRRESKDKDLIVYGSFQMLSIEDEQIFAYIRELDGKRLLVVCNVSPSNREYTIPKEVAIDGSECIISTYEESKAQRTKVYRPYEANVWVLR